jgi:hypothetical protein
VATLREVVPYAVIGALAFLAGILIERFALGGLSAPIFALTAIVAALIPIGGTIAQVYLDQKRADQATARQERKDHATKLARETLLPLSGTEFVGSSAGYSAARLQNLPIGVQLTGEVIKRNVEGLPYWSYAIDHILKDAKIRPTWDQLRTAAQKWNKLKFELDRLTEKKVSASVEKVLGPGFDFAGDIFETPPAKWCNVFRYAVALRNAGFLGQKFTVGTEPYPAAIGRPQTERFVARSGMSIYLGSSTPGELTEEKAAEIYRNLASDEELINGLAELHSSERTMADLLPEFRKAAWEYFQRVDASQKLDGECEICKQYT